jgi:hypothetical protein
VFDKQVTHAHGYQLSDMWDGTPVVKIDPADYQLHVVDALGETFSCSLHHEHNSQHECSVTSLHMVAHYNNRAC